MLSERKCVFDHSLKMLVFFFFKFLGNFDIDKKVPLQIFSAFNLSRLKTSVLF